MVRLVLSLGLLLGGCRFDGGGIPRDADPEVPDADPSCVPTGPELCNGLDDDCDGPADEDFPTLDDPCDGAADTDECMDGTIACNQAGDDVVCTDVSESTVESCDGAAVDEDCDGMVDEGFDVGAGCDGDGDADLCVEGVWECDGNGGRQCTDATGTTVEICDALAADEDCDGSANEDWTFTSNETCGDCFTQCVTNGATSTNNCNSGGICVPECVAGAMDCDGDAAAGCEQRNTTPGCATAIDLGNVRGDAGADVATQNRYAEAWFEVRITETDPDPQHLGATITLTAPAGVNYDLYVYCTANCPVGSLLRSSTNPAGMNDVVDIGKNDGGNSQSFTVLIEVRYSSASACGDYTLTVQGNDANSENDC